MTHATHDYMHVLAVTVQLENTYWMWMARSVICM